MKVKTLLDLFIHDLSDVYSAEKQISRLDQIIDARDKRRIVRLKCHALEGLVADAHCACLSTRPERSITTACEEA